MKNLNIFVDTTNISQVGEIHVNRKELQADLLVRQNEKFVSLELISHNTFRN